MIVGPRWNIWAEIVPIGLALIVTSFHSLQDPAYWFGIDSWKLVPLLTLITGPYWNIWTEVVPIGLALIVKSFQLIFIAYKILPALREESLSPVDIDSWSSKIFYLSFIIQSVKGRYHFEFKHTFFNEGLIEMTFTA